MGQLIAAEITMAMSTIPLEVDGFNRSRRGPDRNPRSLSIAMAKRMIDVELLQKNDINRMTLQNIG